MLRSGICSASDGSIANIKDIQNAIKAIEFNLPQMNKSLLTKMLKGFVDIAKILVRQEAGIFQEVLKWCRLYSNMHVSIDPKDGKLLEQFERTTPAAISYIIAYLQYKAQGVVNYHYSLLQIIDSILQNLPPQILQFGFHFEPETIACIWKPIDLIGDFKVQLLTLKIFATLVKYLGDDKRNAVLNIHKLNDTNLFRDKLNTVIQETPLLGIFEERCRELLNNYNTNSSQSCKIYSFNCKNVSIGCKYDIYRTLNCDKLWINLNFASKMLTFKGRCRLGNEFKAHNIDVYLKVQDIKLIRDTLCVHFDRSHSITSPTNIISDIKTAVVKVHLSSTELKRFNDNPVIMSYIEKIHVDETNGDTDSNNDNKDAFDILRSKKPLCESNFSNNQIRYSDKQHNGNGYDPSSIANDSPVSIKLAKAHIKNHPITQLRSKKRSVSNEEDYIPSNKQRKKHNKKSSSSTKSSGERTRKNKQMPMKNPKAMNNMLSGSARNLNATNAINNGNQYDIGVQHSTGSNSVQCHTMGDDIQNGHNNTSSLRISATDINYNKQLENYKHSATKNLAEFSLKTRSFMKPIECANNGRTFKQPVTDLFNADKSESIEADGNSLHNYNGRTESVNFPDCEELRSSKYNCEESIYSLPNVPKTTSANHDTVIDLTLVTPIKNCEKNIKNELAENHVSFALPKYWSQSIPVTPASSTSIMAISDINDSSCFIDSHNELENDEFHLVNRILNDWKTDSDGDDTAEGFKTIKGQESNFKAEDQNNGAIMNTDYASLIKIPVSKSEEGITREIAQLIKEYIQIDFFKITKEYQLKLQHNLDPLREQYLSKASEIYKHKISKIAETILTESEEQRKELELFQNSFKTLIIQIEGQCELYMNRSKQYQIFQENMECLLNSLENNDLKAVIENEHNEITKQISTKECAVRQQVWQSYLENYRKSILTEMKTIPNL